MPDYLFTPGVDLTELYKKLGEAETRTDDYIKKTEAATKKLEDAFKRSGKGIGDTAGKAGQSLNDLSRIAQDLPFGFIAIQNNINPLLESFQRLRAETGSSGAALKALGTGLIGAGGIGFALSAITAALTFASIGFQAWKGRVSESKKAVDDAKKANDEYVDSLNDIRKAFVQGALDAQKELIAVKNLYDATQNETLSRKDRNEAVDELQKKYPALFANYTNEEILVGKAEGAYNKLKTSILEAARARAASSLLEENFKSQIIAQNVLNDLKTEQLTIETKIGQVDTRSGDGTGGNTGVGRTLKLNQDLLENKNKQNEKQEELNKLQQKSIDINNQIADSQMRGGIVPPGGKTQAEIEEEKRQKKLLEDQKKAATEREQQEKAFQALLLKLQQDTRESQAKAIDDEEQREIAASAATFKTKAENAEKEVKLFEGTAAERKKLSDALKIFEAANTEAAEQAKEGIVKKFADRRKALDDKANADLLKRQADAQKALELLAGESDERQIARIKARYAKLQEDISKGGKGSLLTSAQVFLAQQAEIDEVLIKSGEKRISDQERADLRLIDLDTQYAGKSVEIQKKKEIAKLKVQLDAAKDRLDLLKANGKTDNDQEVQNAIDLINALNNKIDGVNNKTKFDGSKEKDFFEKYFGFGPKTSERILEISEAATAVGKITSDLFGAIADSYQQQVDARKAVVDADDKAIDELQSNLDKQKELYDSGVANNYDALKKQLENKKAMRDEDQKNLEEVQKRQAAARKAQLIADSVAQASNLVTAASGIFEATSFIPPPFGQILAGATIAAMFAAFATARITAIKAAGQTQLFESGGTIGGKTHKQGGQKYYAADGSGDVMELQRDEEVINAKSANKTRPLLKAINDESIHGMGDEELRELLRGSGIHLSEAPKQSVKIIREHTTLKQQVESRSAGHNLTDEVKKIKEDVKYMADKKRNDWETGENENGSWKKKGGLTLFTPKKKN